MEEEKKSELVSYEKRMYKGEHSNWKGTYDYNVQFRNGDVCITGKKNPDAHFIVGEVYFYDYEEKQMTPNWLKKSAKGMKTQAEKDKAEEYAKGKSQSGATGGASKSGGYKMSPEKQKHIMCQVAMISANSIMNKMQEDYDTIVRHFLSFLILNAKDHDPISLQGALKIAAEYWNQVPTEEVTIDTVLSTAKTRIENTEKAGKWDGVIPDTNKPPVVKEEPVINQEVEPSGPKDEEPPKGEDPFLKIV